MSTRFLYALLPMLFACSGVASASEAGHEALPAKAPVLFEFTLPGGLEIPVSNSLVMLLLAVVGLSLFVWLVTRKMTLVPGRWQNFLEWVYETLYGFIENMIGPRLAKKYFWYFGSVFIVIMLSNYMGLIPGVGLIEYTNAAGEQIPLFRGANADMNTTVVLGFSCMALWLYWSIREQGFKHFILHIFGPKGDNKGFLGAVLLPVFIFSGLLECLSIMIRPVAFSARLFGNIFAGESMIETMATASTNPLISALCVLPFYGLELLVGFIQALVFVLLAAVFLKMQVGDEEFEGDKLVSPNDSPNASPKADGNPTPSQP